MLSLKEFKKLYVFSSGYFSSVLPSKGQVCCSGSIFIYIKEFDLESLEGEAAELVPHFLLSSVHKPVSFGEKT